jgi:hypothetical protein
MNHSERVSLRASYTGGFPFEPTGGIRLAVTDTTGRVALVGAGDQVVVTNKDATEWAHVIFGDSTITATLDDFPIPPGEQLILTIPSISSAAKATHVAAIADAGGTVAMQFETGWGL